MMGLPSFTFRHPELLGTVVDITIGAPDEGTANPAADLLFREIERLEAVFSVFDPNSELCQWRQSSDPAKVGTSDEFNWLMGETLRWQQATDGLFNPLAGEMMDLWAEVSTERQSDNSTFGNVPDRDLLADRADAISVPRFEIVDGHPVATGDCSRLNLNAIAKGFIVDQALAKVWQECEVGEALVNAGGDIRHVGLSPVRIGVEDPAQPFDNSPPLIAIDIHDEAIATSGSSRRYFTVGERRFNHVIDPRSGQPASGSASVTVVAQTAMVADVLATALNVVKPDQALELVDRLDVAEPLAVLIVDHDQRQHLSARWTSRFST